MEWNFYTQKRICELQNAYLYPYLQISKKQDTELTAEVMKIVSFWTIKIFWSLFLFHIFFLVTTVSHFSTCFIYLLNSKSSHIRNSHYDKASWSVDVIEKEMTWFSIPVLTLVQLVLKKAFRIPFITRFQCPVHLY